MLCLQNALFSESRFQIGYIYTLLGLKKFPVISLWELTPNGDLFRDWKNKCRGPKDATDYLFKFPTEYTYLIEYSMGKW